MDDATSSQPTLEEFVDEPRHARVGIPSGGQRCDQEQITQQSRLAEVREQQHDADERRQGDAGLDRGAQRCVRGMDLPKLLSSKANEADGRDHAKRSDHP